MCDLIWKEVIYSANVLAVLRPESSTICDVNEADIKLNWYGSGMLRSNAIL